jgi:hypothetical protein
MSLYAPGALITAGGKTYGGTSQATPHVAGAVAVLKAAVPSATLDQIVTALRETGKPIRVPRQTYVKPRLNLEAAVEFLKGTPLPRDTDPPSDATLTLTPVIGADGEAATLQVLAQLTSADPSGIAIACLSNAPLASSEACSPYRPYTAAGLTWTLADGADGSRTVYAWAADAAGNFAPSPATASISVKRTPRLEILAGDSNVTRWRNLTLSVMVPAASSTTEMCITDRDSAKSAADCKASQWAPYSPIYNFKFSSGRQGVKALKLFIRDKPAVGAVTAAVVARVEAGAASILFDSAAPSMPGTVKLKANATSSSIAVSFVPAARDVGTGIASYLLVMREGSRPPSRCSTFDASPSSSTSSTFLRPPGGWVAGAVLERVFEGLPPRTRFGFRVCAVDGAGNIATGRVKYASTSKAL